MALSFNQLCDRHYDRMFDEYYHINEDDFDIDEAFNEFVNENVCHCDECKLKDNCEIKIDYDNKEIDKKVLRSDCKSYLEDEMKGSEEFDKWVKDNYQVEI